MMKRFLYGALLIATLWSCEDVIEVDLETAPPRLVVEASINWFKGGAGDVQTILLTTTASFYQEEVPPATGASVTITDEAGNEFIFTEVGATGRYENIAFIPVIDREYTLTILYEGETYTATETLKSVVAIEYVTQDKEGGFTGESTEIKAYYTDPAGEENHYFFKFRSDAASDQDVYKDEFFDGNPIFGLYIEDDLDTGDQVTIQSFGVSKAYYNYMFTLLTQFGVGGGGFETQPATVRGNVINQTDPDHYPYGYFRLSEADEFVYVVE